MEPAELAGTPHAAIVVPAMSAARINFIGFAMAIGFTSCAQRPVSYAEARTVVDHRCIECHSARPANKAFAFAPRGVRLDTALEMQQYAGRIEASVAVDRTMPLANMTGMTDKERRVLDRWVQNGAKIP